MAKSADIYDRINIINPWAMDCIRKLSEKIGSVGLIVTEDMTREEKIMEGVAYYLKQGMAFEEAKKEAVVAIEMMENIQASIKEDPQDRP